MPKKSKICIDDTHFHGLMNAFKNVPEPRKNILNVLHPLYEIITIAVCGVIAGAEGPMSRMRDHPAETTPSPRWQDSAEKSRPQKKSWRVAHRHSLCDRKRCQSCSKGHRGEKQ